MPKLLVENISKRFPDLSTKSGLIRALLGKEDFQSAKQVLTDIHFELPQGECLGLIGHNGSGKSTLLQIVSGIMPPSSGHVRFEGHIQPIMKLANGLYADLNVLENTKFLLSMIDGESSSYDFEKIQSIIRFARLEPFCKSKVGSLSSGMAAKLVFSACTHTDSDLFLLDEIFAVGDLHFQSMFCTWHQNLRTSKRSAILVSHDLKIIKAYCERTILLKAGRVVAIDETSKIIDLYNSIPDEQNTNRLPRLDH